MVDMSFALKLKALRDEAGLTQKDLQKATGINNVTISKFERGVVTDPSMNTLRKLSNFFGVSVHFFRG